RHWANAAAATPRRARWGRPSEFVTVALVLGGAGLSPPIAPQVAGSAAPFAGGRRWRRRRVGPTDGSGRTGSVAGHQEQAAPSATAAPARGAGRAGRARAPRRRAPAAQPVAAQLPVARVLVDVPPAHLDRPFDYLVPQRMAAAALPPSPA